MSKPYIAVNRVSYGGTSYEPGSFVFPTGTDEALFTKHRAIRELTEEEFALHQRTTGLVLADQPVANGHPEVSEAPQTVAVETATGVADPDLDHAPAAEINPNDTDRGDDGLGLMTNAQLKALAEAEQIDLGTATNKAGFVAAIRAARGVPTAPAAADEDLLT
ncbi:hypothetical protein AEAC466_04225 [Asticcacaulis sp. AC466]|uniref:hypothetical protein n=1 Tax=Asticcacaulis sp. AC466 TaxID=1282362 RepID=UPI0003C3B9B3|nr:hypothetical protein [Asticcacaulis sp. AC466]ESQ85506.1 hypothetical protein AEAC466_04225 [Asticcacaulis sp. AC466]